MSYDWAIRGWFSTALYLQVINQKKILLKIDIRFCHTDVHFLKNPSALRVSLVPVKDTDPPFKYHFYCYLCYYSTATITYMLIYF